MSFLPSYIALFLICTPMFTSVLAQDAPQDFLDPHNKARAAVGVGPLSWNKSVATYARKFADLRSDDCRLSHSNGEFGENIFWGSLAQNWTAADAVAMWVSERQFYDCASNSCAAGQACNHYTQVVWANSTSVGCARKTCAGANTFIACEYYPPGNLPGESPYAGCVLYSNIFRNDDAASVGYVNISRNHGGALRNDRGAPAPAPAPAPGNSNSSRNDGGAPAPAPAPAHGNSNSSRNDGGAPAPAPAPGNSNSSRNDGGAPRNSSRAPSASLSSDDAKHKSRPIPQIVIPLVIAVGLIPVFCTCIWKRRSKIKQAARYEARLEEEVEDIKSVLFDLSLIREATSNFAELNKLGEGGFGQVYKGKFPDGREIAVKRLSKSSKQGIHELKNELVLVAKLQHKNLVQLLGACLQKDEKLLVYEYIPNKSLDTFIFDNEKRKQLVWATRYKVICGIARGLVYLHEESHLKVIHRDLKPSNILLEMDMNPKISDFGLARVFEGDHTKDVTRRVAGTYGYMSPEYAILGHVSTKSDVFSFGVIILEIVTGRRNTTSSEPALAEHLLSFVWKNWISGTVTEIVDSSMRNNCAESEVLKCIHIGLLCVQENPSDRPNMSTVAMMLSSKSACFQTPSRPAYLFGFDGTNLHRNPSSRRPEAANDRSGPSKSTSASLNGVTITELDPR